MYKRIVSRASTLSFGQLVGIHRGRHRGASGTSRLKERAVILWSSWIDSGQTLPRS
jgi:hypothetical protein